MKTNLSSEFCSQQFLSFVDRDMTARFMGTGIGHGASRQQFDDVLEIIRSRDEDGAAVDEDEADDRRSSEEPANSSGSEIEAGLSKIAADNDEEELAEHEVDEDENFDMDKWETDSEEGDEGDENELQPESADNSDVELSYDEAAESGDDDPIDNED